MKRLAAAVLVSLGSLGALPSSASAEMPATIRGVAYSCTTGAPIAGAYVLLRATDGGSENTLRTDARGAFARVGVAPGSYIVFVGGPVHDSTTVHARPASRLARVETDDVLEVRIGTQLIAVPPRIDYPIVVNAHAAQALHQPEPVCDAPLVPPAPSTSGRYIIH